MGMEGLRRVRVILAHLWRGAIWLLVMNGCGVDASSASVDAAAVRTLVENSARVRGRHGDAERLAVESQRVYHQSRKGLPYVVIHSERSTVQARSESSLMCQRYAVFVMRSSVTSTDESNGGLVVLSLITDPSSTPYISFLDYRRWRLPIGRRP